MFVGLWTVYVCTVYSWKVNKISSWKKKEKRKSWVQTKPTYRENLGNIFESLGSSWIIFNTLSMSFDFKVRE